MRRPYALVLPLVLAACRSAPRPVPPTAVAMPEAPAPVDTSTVVRALAAPAMPRCEAGDPLAVASLTPGLPASPALARRADGGLVAFVVDPHRDGHPTLRLLPLDREGSSVTNGVAHSPIDLDDAGASPSLPALVPTRDGYLLAWRQGPAGQHRIALRTLGPDGTPGPAARLLAPTGVLGAPALALRDDRPVVAVARSTARSPGEGRSDATAWAAFIDRVDPDDSVHSAPAPEGGAFTGEAPRVAVTPRGVAVWATVARDHASPADERALVRLDDDRPTLVARDLDHPSVLPLGDRTLVAWRARVARRDTAARAAVLSADDTVTEAPLTLATYRGASDLHVALTPIGHHRVAALSLSTLADDAGGSINLSLLDDNGRYLGRAPLLTGFLTRSAELSVAATPEADEALVAVDGRDVDDGTPQLILTRVRCHASETVAPLDLPPATFVQEPIAPDAPAVTLARPQSTAADMACTARGSGDFVAHVDANTNASALAHTTSAVVLTPSGATLLAIVRSAADAPGRLVVSTLNAQRRLTPLPVGRQSASDLLAASRVPGGAALAVISYPLQSVERLDLVTVRGASVTHALFPTLRDPSAAAIVPETGEVYVVAKTSDGAPVLARVSAGRPPVVLSTLRDGDTLLDAVRDVDRTALLLARPDTLGEEVSLTLAARFIGATTPSRDDEPFADPLGHVAGTALWHHLPGRSLAVLSHVGPTLRIAELDRDMLRNPRSLLAVHPSGGEILAGAVAGPRHWLALATGIAPEGQRAASLTFAALDRGTLAGAHFRLPDDASAIAGGVSLDADESHLVALYPRSAERGLTWRWIDLTCNLPGAAR